MAVAADSLFWRCSKEPDADDVLLPRTERDCRRRLALWPGAGEGAGERALLCLACSSACISSEANTSLFSRRSTFFSMLFDLSWASFSWKKKKK